LGEFFADTRDNTKRVSKGKGFIWTESPIQWLKGRGVHLEERLSRGSSPGDITYQRPEKRGKGSPPAEKRVQQDWGRY